MKWTPSSDSYCPERGEDRELFGMTYRQLNSLYDAFIQVITLGFFTLNKKVEIFTISLQWVGTK